MTEIKPALTAEEWTTARFSSAGFWNLFPLYVDGVYQPQNAPKLAALLLDDEPFGFTREDVAMLRDVGLSSTYASGQDAEYARLDNLADRIKALLPPEKPCPTNQ